MKTTMRSSLERMRAIDVAWNARHWTDYSDLLAENLVAYAGGEERPHSKLEHIQKARSFCEAFPDNVVHIDPYLEIFASHDGRHTCSVARITGTAKGDLKMPGGASLAPVHRAFDVTFTAVCRWQDRRIVEQREFFDMELMLRQLRGDVAPSTPSR